MLALQLSERRTEQTKFVVFEGALSNMLSLIPRLSIHSLWISQVTEHRHFGQAISPKASDTAS